MNVLASLAAMDDFDTLAPSRAPAPASSPCIRCCGRGTVTIGYVHVRSGTCFACNGTGRITEKRKRGIAAAKKGAVTMAANLDRKQSAWIIANPAAAQWIADNCDRNDFAGSMREALRNYGALTVNQLAAVMRGIERNAERAAARVVEQKANAVQTGDGAAAMLAAMKSARAAGKKSPIVRTERFTFTLAKDASRNPGCIYVTTKRFAMTEGGAGYVDASEDKYCGKIDPTGAFIGSRECTPEARASIVAICVDPLKAAIEYGKESGVCSCCGRKLTDPVSIERGIGPICASNFFGA